MSVTRLLVLGAVRIFQPAHGYLVRRELASWQVEEWGHLNPGSVYNALRTLAREGMLVVDDPTDADSRSAGKVRYRLTGDGETEFQRLVRLGLWEVHPYEPQWLLAGLSFWWALSRQEVIDALAARRTQLEARIAATGYAVQTIRQTPFKPEHVVEHFLLHVEILRGELAWVDEVTERVKDGAYHFLGEPADDAYPVLGEPASIPKL
jgi:DNA-binding PadR family transcriptional regulator